ncbi:MAG: hypothetical protein IPG69_04905 [Flavobacteriales bacterium]|nr:hypothetical protein [Flavobacteriales bacterium]
MAVEDDVGARESAEASATHTLDSAERMGTGITRSRLQLLAQQQGKPAGVQEINSSNGRKVEVLLPLMTAA